MRWKHASRSAMIIITAALTALITVNGCGKDNNPVTAPASPLSFVKKIMTPGAPLGGCVYSDTLFVADGQLGIAKYKISNDYQAIGTISPGRASRAIMWIKYDSLRHKIIAANRVSATNRFTENLYEPRDDTLSLMVGLEIQNSSFSTIFHSPDTSLRIIKCQVLGDGFLVRRAYTLLANDSVIWQVESAPGYRPANRSSVRMVHYGLPYTFAAVEEYGFVVLNTANSAVTPIEVAHLDLPGECNWLTVRDSVAYVATKYSGIGVVSVSNPTNPQLLTMLELKNSSNQYQIEISTDGKKLFVLDGTDGVYVFDRSNRNNPVYMGLIPVVRGFSILCDSNKLYVFSEAEGVLVYE